MNVAFVMNSAPETTRLCTAVPARETPCAGAAADRSGGVGVNAPPPRPSLVINALSGWAGLAVQVVVGFLLTPVIIAHLQKSGYAIYTLIGSVIGYYGILDLGVSTAVRRYVARYAATQDHVSINRTVSAALLLFSVTSAAVLLGATLAANPLGQFLGVQPGQIDDFRQALWILSLNEVISLVARVYSATIAAYEYFVIRNTIIIASTVLRAGLTVWLLWAGLGLMGVALAYLASTVLSLTANAAACRRKAPMVRPRFRLATWSAMRALLGFGITTTIISAAYIISMNLTSVIIARRVSLEAVAVYGVAAILLQYFSDLVGTGMAVLAPRFANLHGAQDMRQFRSLLVKSLWIASVLSCLLGLFLMTLSGRFVRLWVGEGFAEAVMVVMVLTVSRVLGASQTPAINAIFAVNKHKYLAATTIAEGFCAVGLSILLAPAWGIVGVAAGIMVPSLIVGGLVQPVYMARLYGMRLRTYLWPMLATIAPAGALYLAWQGVVEPRIPPGGYLGLCVMGICITLLYLAAIVVSGEVASRALGRKVGLPVMFLLEGRRLPAFVTQCIARKASVRL